MRNRGEKAIQPYCAKDFGDVGTTGTKTIRRYSSVYRKKISVRTLRILQRWRKDYEGVSPTR